MHNKYATVIVFKIIIWSAVTADIFIDVFELLHLLITVTLIHFDGGEMEPNHY